MHKETSETTEIIERFLLEKPEKDFFTYQELSQAAGVDIQARRGYFYTAAKHLMKDEGIVFKCIAGQGYAKCKEPEKIDKGRTGFGKIKRCTGRHVKMVEAADIALLPPEKKNEAFLVGSAYNLIRHVLRRKTQRRIAEAVTSKCFFIPTRESAAMLKG